MPLIFPTQLFNPRGVKLWLANSTVQSGQSLSGVIDVIRTDGGGLRMLELSGIVLKSPDAIRAWEAWQAELAAGVNVVTVPVPINAYAPRPLAAGKPMPYSQLNPTSNDPYFPEAFGYGVEMVQASIASPASFRAVQLDIELTKGDKIRGGETFSINHATKGNHIYKINRVLARVGDVYTVSIDCPLREAIAGGESANFDWPMCDMVQMPDTDISLLIENRRSEVSITFREYL